MKGRVFERRMGGGGGKGTIVIKGLSTSPGWGVDSVEFSLSILLRNTNSYLDTQLHLLGRRVLLYS